MIMDYEYLIFSLVQLFKQSSEFMTTFTESNIYVIIFK